MRTPIAWVASCPILMAVLLICRQSSLAQVTLVWTEHYNGSANGADYARDMKLDADGNAYITGTSVENGSGRDITTAKFDAEGVELWTATYNGTDNGDDWGYSLALDDAGNVYVTGSSYFTATGRDFATIKYDAQGEEQWARSYDGPAHLDDEAAQVVVDHDGNVVVSGSSQGIGTLSDYATVKYSSAGDQLWAERYNGPGNNVDEGRALAADQDGNVYVSGGSQDSLSGYDYATIKYSSSGLQQWVARYDGPGHGYDVVYYAGSVAVDADGVVITGYSTGTDSTYDYATIKYDAQGNPLWVTRYGSVDYGMDYADALSIDPLGNIYVTGASFDSSSGFDYLTIKYDATGATQWTASYNGTGNGWDEAYGIAVDSLGDVYVMGRSPGVATSTDFVTVKYASSGEELWQIRADGTAHGFDWPFRLQLDSFQAIYVGGWSTESETAADYTVIKYSQSTAAEPGRAFLPPTVILFQNYPNPFNSTTTISYFLPTNSHIRLIIHDILGREVAGLVNAHQHAGLQSVLWNAGELASGTFYCTVETPMAVQTRAVILTK